MKIFNAIQLVVLLVAFPFLISWLETATFRGASAFYYSAACLYVVQLMFTVFAYVAAWENL